MAGVSITSLSTKASNFIPLGDDEGTSFYARAFEHLSLPKLQLKNPPQQEYIIYKNAQEFVVVVANTALEAMMQSEVERPYKILHPGNRLACIIDNAKLKVSEKHAVSGSAVIEEHAKPVPEAASVEAPAETAVTEVAPAAAEPTTEAAPAAEASKPDSA